MLDRDTDQHPSRALGGTDIPSYQAPPRTVSCRQTETGCVLADREIPRSDFGACPDCTEHRSILQVTECTRLHPEFPKQQVSGCGLVDREFFKYLYLPWIEALYRHGCQLPRKRLSGLGVYSKNLSPKICWLLRRSWKLGKYFLHREYSL